MVARAVTWTPVLGTGRSKPSDGRFYELPEGVQEEFQKTYMIQDVLVGDLNIPPVETVDVDPPPMNSLRRYNRRVQRRKRTRILYDFVHRNLLLEKHIREDLTCTEVVAKETLDILVEEKGQEKEAEQQRKEAEAEKQRQQRVDTLLHKPDEATKAAAAKPIRKTKGRGNRKAATKKKQLKPVIPFGSKPTGGCPRRNKR